MESRFAVLCWNGGTARWRPGGLTFYHCTVRTLFVAKLNSPQIFMRAGWSVHVSSAFRMSTLSTHCGRHLVWHGDCCAEVEVLWFPGGILLKIKLWIELLRLLKLPDKWLLVQNQTIIWTCTPKPIMQHSAHWRFVFLFVHPDIICELTVALECWEW
jgi:hypothetical protein